MKEQLKKVKAFNIGENDTFSVIYTLEKENDEYLLKMELSDIAVLKNKQYVDSILNSVQELFEEQIKEGVLNSIYVPSTAYIHVEESYSGVYIDVNYPADNLSDTNFLTDDVYELEDEDGNMKEVGDIGICLVEVKQDEDCKNSVILEFKSFTVVNEKSSVSYLWNSLIKENIYEELSQIFD